MMVKIMVMPQTYFFDDPKEIQIGDIELRKSRIIGIKTDLFNQKFTSPTDSMKLSTEGIIIFTNH